MAITVEDVRAVINVVEEDFIIDAMMETANQMLVNSVDTDTTLSTAARDQVQIWLSAHFLAVRDRLEKEISADGIRIVFDGTTDMGLNATLYGQQAQLLDPTGLLAKAASSKGRLNFYVEKDFTSRYENL